MNNNKTTLEVDALEWWEGLTQLEKERIANYHHISVSSLTIGLAVKLYTAEHSTAPTVENNEDSSSEVPELLHEGNGTIVIAELKGRIFMTVNKDFVKYADYIVQRSNDYSKLLEDNKLLREALQGIINDWTERMHGEIEVHKETTVGGDGRKYWSPSSATVSSQFMAAARKALEQTK